ncbi:MAG TPA: hypothetical protein VF173_23290 [Thermoanaerobaculia bacterium]|nr:hypothetical protein [Thermoanaerobaculia bacterium]
MKRYESRYCTFAVPDDWEAEPPFAFVRKADEEGRWTAQVLERCLVQVLPAAAHLKQQKESLPYLYEGFELLAEGPHRPEGPGEGFVLTFRFLDEEENESRAQAFYLILGPLACQLVLASPDRPDRERDRLFAAIAKTFVFRQVEFLAKTQSVALTSEILRTPQPMAARGWSGTWRKFPRACVSLPTPSGWEVTEENGDALFRRGSAEIHLHRDLEGHGDPANWFAQRMKRLQDSGDLLLGSETGELERGSYAAVLCEEKGVGRTWKTAAVIRSFDLFLRDQQPLLWTLKAPEVGFPDQRSLLESLIAAAEFLDPAEWETKLVEPWIDYTLRGPWQAEGPGVYANAREGPVFVQLGYESTTFSLEKLKPSILESMRQGLQLRQGFTERSSAGVWRRHDAFHYAVDGYALDSGSILSARAIWLVGQRRLFNIFIRGNVSESTEALAIGLLEAFQPLPLN